MRVRPNEVSLSDPHDFHEIYDTKTKYDKTQYFKRFAIYGEDNLFSTTTYADHQAKKRRLAADYGKSRVNANAEAFVRERIAALIRQLEAATNGLVDFFVLYDCFAHDVMTRFLFGVSHSTNTLEEAADRPLVVGLKRSQLYTPLWVNFEWLAGSWLLRKMLGPEYERNGEYGTMVKRHIERLMSEHEQDADRDEEYSLYRSLRHAKIDWTNNTRNYIASETYDDLKAGQQTTASTLTYITWYLTRYPHWQKRLQTEVCDLLVMDESEPSLHEIEACRVLDAVIKETMRLHPVASNRSERLVPEGGRSYSGVFVPGGTIVYSPNAVVQCDSSVFEESDSWKPERWLDAEPEKLKAMEYSWVPFGYGARICIGQHLAWMELKLLIASLYRQFSTSLSETSTDQDMIPLNTLATVPRGLRCELYVAKDAV